MKNYKVRWLQAVDKENWLIMWQEYMEFYQTSLPAKVVKNTVNALLSDNKNIGCLIACDSQNGAIGFLTFILHLSTWNIEPECYLHDLFVKPEHRKAGVAKMLMEELKQISRLRQWSKVYWITKPDNQVARTLYDKIGRGESWIMYVMAADEAHSSSPSCPHK
ncbi:GNAT family N-acetyltransferase [Legionella resiliens]|uniref:GNAT family N-acetyltransferase n=1 Tax=Legionella resiliens TaxID=2905958 RepID=A0ABS8X0H7_9GAMM|nr:MULTISPECIES: GNAT family N-acetyltransferase [unclassified Legionella]MCE0721641.1 GNAT family N-acetyltransferase [Legionella sp. 9fVS26]MCE3530795.1 GNAT family N-acetyltransferase [Legionella sp. 8cVS16]